MNFNCSVIPNFHKKRKKKEKKIFSALECDEVMFYCQRKTIHCLKRHHRSYFQSTEKKNNLILIRNQVVP